MIRMHRTIWQISFIVLLGLLAACAPAASAPLETPSAAQSVPPTPAWTPTPTAPPTSTPIPSPTPVPTLTETATSIPLPTATLDASLYPAPLPFLQAVNGIDTSGCPDLSGVEKANNLPAQTALDVLTALTSGDPTLFRQASDQTFWNGNPGVPPVLSDLTIHPAAQAPYASGIKVGCGQKTLELSWWIQDGSGARAAHYFLIDRKGHWLVWASYP